MNYVSNLRYISFVFSENFQEEFPFQVLLKSGWDYNVNANLQLKSWIHLEITANMSLTMRLLKLVKSTP